MIYELISREDAAAKNRKRFYTGKPCKYGHDSQRHVSTGGCVACNAAKSRSFFLDAQRTMGQFSYPLKHAGDLPAAWAYCQLLDLAAGRVPAQEPADTDRGGDVVAPAPIGRAEAHAAGKTHYFTGRPCRAGHVSVRYVSTGTCKACLRAHQASFSTQSDAGARISYPLASADHPAAWAYCQSLDLARGLAPTLPPESPMRAATAEEIEAKRMAVFGCSAPPPPESRVLHPDMEAQLRAAGLLRGT